MKKIRPVRRITAGILTGILVGLFVCRGTMANGAPAQEQEVKLEKSAVWESPEDYQATINLKVNGIEKYTQKEVPISVIPLLDVTGSMEYCETEGHHHEVFSHPFASYQNAAEIWKNEIAPALPDPNSYSQLAQAGPEQMFLYFPQEADPLGKCRLVYLENQQDQRDYYEMANWRVFYVTDDATPLYPLKAGHGIYGFWHTILQDGAYIPVGTVRQTPYGPAWSYANYKEPGHGCEASRMDQLKEGYAQFVQTHFENPGAKICPIAFVGGYYINGWTDNPQEAIDFLCAEEYLQKEQVLPDYNYGTNYEAALAGALDAAGRLEKRENTFAILFTDGEASSGYDHSSGKPDVSRLDPHSFDMPQQDESWYSAYAEWAVEDAAVLKEMISLYTVGYGFNLDTEKPLGILQQISSGLEYYIDSRSSSAQSVMDIFRAIYSDMIQKATKVHMVDYISEFWRADREKLPPNCKAEEIPITNQKGQSDVIDKLTYSITREMGADGQEEIQIPIVLREEYRDVEAKTLFETNQDAPLCKDREGAGARVEYVDLEGEERIVTADTPRLDVYPAQPDFLLEKEPLEKQAKAGGQAGYQFRLTNCGQAVLNQIRLEDFFHEKDMKLIFDPAEGAALEAEGGALLIDSLGLGEERVLTGFAEIPEDAQGNIENTARATAVNPKAPQNNIEKEAKAAVDVLPLSLDFQVEKTADKKEASLGEELTYQIRIVNTGERKLRSMVVLDQFEKADVQAVFQERETAAISGNGTEARIESILPGEEAVLTAVAKIPADFAEESLVNTALAYPEGREDLGKSAKASVQVKKIPAGDALSGNVKQPPMKDGKDDEKNNGKENEKEEEKKEAATATPKALYGQNGQSASAATPRPSYTSTAGGTNGSKGDAASTSPKTEDSAPLAPLFFLLGISGAAIGELLYMKFHKKKASHS